MTQSSTRLVALLVVCVCEGHALAQTFASHKTSPQAMSLAFEGAPPQQNLPALRKKAAHGDVGAQSMLGVLYEYGYQIPKNYAQARYWLTKAAQQGDHAAQINLGMMYDQGWGVKADLVQAAIWYDKASASSQIDQSLVEAPPPVLIQQARLGEAAAQRKLADWYASQLLSNTTDSHQDYAKQAFSWYQKAAQQRDALAATELAGFYEVGLGTDRDDQQAVKYYQQAASQHEPRAIYQLGIRYATGKGVKQDIIYAEQLLIQAAQSGQVDLQIGLAQLYRDGEQGFKPNLQKARYWYQQAAKQGDSKAKEALDHLAIQSMP